MTAVTSTSVHESAASAEQRRGREWWRAWIARPAHYRAVNNLRAALVEQDVDRIEVLLHPGAALVVDSGSETGPGKRVFMGARNAAAGLIHGASSGVGNSLDVRSVNGQAGLVLRLLDDAVAVICVDFTAGLVSTVWVRLHPEQLRHGNHI